MSRKDEIIEKSVEVIRDEGFYAFTMEKLSLSLGIKKASLYYYFKGKDELVSSIHEYFVKELKKKNFSFDFKKDEKLCLISLFEHYLEIFLSPHFSSYISFLLESRSFMPSSDEILSSLLLMMESQIEVIFMHYKSKKAKEKASLLSSYLIRIISDMLISEKEAEMEKIESTIALLSSH